MTRAAFSVVCSSEKVFDPYGGLIRASRASDGTVVLYTDAIAFDYDDVQDGIREYLRCFREWDESEHPRDEDGKWTDGGGDGGSEDEGGDGREAASDSDDAVVSFQAREKDDIKPIERSKQNLELWKRDDFPHLNMDTANVVGTEDGKTLVGFNCVGNAVDDKGRWWFPFKAGDITQNRNEFFWPSEAKRGTGTAKSEVEAFDDLLIRIGNGKVTKNEKVEEGFVKLALFTLRGRPTHIARQVSTGQWLSKLGFSNMIAHDLYDLDKNKNNYGNVAKIYKVPIEDFVKLKDMK